MARKLAYLFVVLCGLCTWPMASGCHEKTTSIERSESVHESEPQMVSPGRERVE